MSAHHEIKVLNIRKRGDFYKNNIPYYIVDLSITINESGELSFQNLLGMFHYYAQQKLEFVFTMPEQRLILEKTREVLELDQYDAFRMLLECMQVASMNISLQDQCGPEC